MYKNLHKFFDVVEYFALRDWEFTTDNVNALWKKIDSRDREIFSFDIRTVSWLRYMELYTIGLREYVFKDSYETLDIARRKQLM